MRIGGRLVRGFVVAPAAAVALVALAGGTVAHGTPLSGSRGGNPFDFRGTLDLPGVKLGGDADAGRSLALSADGKTAVVGINDHRKQTVWIFTAPRNGGWQQAPARLKLAAVPSASAALSADGKTALVGTGTDAAWIFRNRGGGTWVGTKLKAKGGKGPNVRFGARVALSVDGKTALVGGPGDETRRVVGTYGKGAVWTFTRSGNNWTQLGGKLTGKGEGGKGEFGSSVALSADGTTAVVGAYHDTDGDGAAWFYTRSGTGWVQQGPKQFDARVPNPVARGDFDAEFGRSAALSADGSTALIGASLDFKGDGAVYVYERSGSSWQEQARLTPAEQAPKAAFGRSVALSADASIALIGAPLDDRYARFPAFGRGAAWVFSRLGPGSSFVQRGGKLAHSEWYFGDRLALSADGNTALIAGAPYFGNGNREVYVFESPSIVFRVNPRSGPTTGGTAVTVEGSGFTAVRAVTFGSAPAASYSVDSPTQITAVSPPGQAGTVDVRVSTSIGISDATFPDEFTYLNQPTVTALTPATGPSAGGTEVTITGTDFSQATAVHFGGAEAAFKVDSDTQIRSYAPLGVPGETVDVTVTTPAGTSAANANARFTYESIIM